MADSYSWLTRCFAIAALCALTGCGGGGGGDGNGARNGGGGDGGSSGGGGGGSPTQTPSPNLIGLDEAAAIAAITNPLVLGTVFSTGTLGGATPRVVAQYPEAGVPLNPGTYVDFTLTAHPAANTAPLRIAATSPRQGDVVGDSFTMSVSAHAQYQIAHAIATVLTTNVALQPGSSGASGVVSVAGRPWGNERIKVRLDDTRENFAEVSIPVLHDNPPQLSVIQPTPDSVAMPTLAVDVSCIDDRPGCVVNIHGPSTGSSRPLLATGTGGFVGTVDLTQSIGVASVAEPNCPLGSCLRIAAQDAAGNSTAVTFHIFVEKPGRLTQVVRLPGNILDLDATRALTLETITSGERLSIYTRATGAVEQIVLPAGIVLYATTPRLTPNGVIFMASPGPRIYLSRSGTLLDFGLAEPWSLRVSGAYAAWNGSSALYRLDTRAGTPTFVSSTHFTGSVAEDGTVVFIRTSGQHQLVRDRDGVQTQLTNEADYAPVSPLTDGTNVVYRHFARDGSGSAIAFISDSQPPVVLSHRSNRIGDFSSNNFLWPPEAGINYQIDGGWTAFTQLTDLYYGYHHVFTRDPTGQIVQRIDFNFDSSVIDELAPNGELMALNDRPIIGTRYFSRPGSLPIEIGMWNGKSYFVDGAWYVVLGGTLLSVDTQMP